MRIGYIITSLQQLLKRSHADLFDLNQDDHIQYLNTLRHDLVLRHPLATLDPLVCSEAEAAALIATHATVGDAHHNRIHSHSDHTNRLRQFWLPASAGYHDGILTVHQEFSAIEMVDGASKLCNISFQIPTTFISYSKIFAIFVSENNDCEAYIRFCTDFAEIGELASAHGVTGAFTQVRVEDALTLVTTDDDITVAPGALAVGDYLGVRFQRSGSSVYDTVNGKIWLLGFVFEFTCDQ